MLTTSAKAFAGLLLLSCCLSCAVKCSGGMFAVLPECRILGPVDLYKKVVADSRSQHKRRYLLELSKSGDMQAEDVLLQELDDYVSWYCNSLKVYELHPEMLHEKREISSEEYYYSETWRDNVGVLLNGLGKKNSSRAVDSIIRILNCGEAHGGFSEIFGAIYTLGEIGDARALPALRRYLAVAEDGYNPQYWSIVGHRAQLRVAISAIEAHNKALQPTR